MPVRGIARSLPDTTLGAPDPEDAAHHMQIHGVRPEESGKHRLGQVEDLGSSVNVLLTDQQVLGDTATPTLFVLVLPTNVPA